LGGRVAKKGFWERKRETLQSSMKEDEIKGPKEKKPKEKWLKSRAKTENNHIDVRKGNQRGKKLEGGEGSGVPGKRKV